MCMSGLCILVSASACSSLPKRARGDELESTTEVTESTQDDLGEPPVAKKSRFIQRVGLEVLLVGIFFFSCLCVQGAHTSPCRIDVL